MNAGELERKSIASDLHDSVAQTLAFTITELKNMKESDLPLNLKNITVIEEQLEQAATEIRSMIYKLRPPILDDFEIDIALDYLIDGYNENHDCQIEFVQKNTNRFKTSKAVRLALYRSTNELIVNFLKHSETKKAKIKLSSKDDCVLLYVEDNGIGFDLDQIKRPNSTTFGLYSLSERITNLGGDFEIFSKPGKGTMAMITIPFTSRQEF